jgi:hypothetical protein
LCNIAVLGATGAMLAASVTGLHTRLTLRESMPSTKGLLSEATVEAPRSPPVVTTSRMAIMGADIREFLERTPEENHGAFIRKIVESVQSESYLSFATDEERTIADEANRDKWERPSGKKKRRTWRRGR